MTKSTVHICFHIQDATESEAGLALFLLKDLWQGELTLGGEAGVGRGKLRGIKAVISYAGQKYTIEKDGKVTQGSKEKLEKYAQSFVDGAKHEKEA